jgi:hypothetical protein
MPAGSKSAEGKMEQKPVLVHSSRSNTSEGKRDNDDDFKLEVWFNVKSFQIASF